MMNKLDNQPMSGDPYFCAPTGRVYRKSRQPRLDAFNQRNQSTCYKRNNLHLLHLTRERVTISETSLSTCHRHIRRHIYVDVFFPFPALTFDSPSKLRHHDGRTSPQIFLSPAFGFRGYCRQPIAALSW